MDFTEENFNALLKKAEDLSQSVEKLEKNNQSLLQEKAEAKKQAKERAEAERVQAEKVAKSKGDIEALESSYNEKINAIENKYSDMVKNLSKKNYDLTVGIQAANLASELSVKGSEEVYADIIKRRLTLEDDQVRVLDKAGNLSAATIDELKSELMNTPAYAPFTVGSKASGTGIVSKPGAASKKFNEYTSGELVEIKRTNPEQYEQLKNAYYS